MIFQPRTPDFVWPRTGVGVGIVTPTGYILLRRASGKLDAGSWSFPGGALEPGETLAECAARESFEEIGVRISNVRKLPLVTEDIFPDQGEHWITHYLLATTEDLPINREPHKCDGLITAWPDAMPRPLFVGIPELITKNLLPLSVPAQ